MSAGDSETIVRIERAVTSCLQPLTGTRSTGFVLVRATGADVVVPAGSYALPIVRSAAGNPQIDWRAMLKTTSSVANANPPASTTVTSAGTLVPITSVLGGLSQNLAPGTRVRWDPQIIGVEAESVIDTGGMTGGTAPNGPETVSRVVSVDGTGPATINIDAFKAFVGNFPALMVSWEGSQTQPKRGIGRTPEVHTFRVFIFVDRFDGTSPRRDEGKRILDAVKRNLFDRAHVDGEVFSAPAVIGSRAGRITANATAMAFFVDIDVQYTAISYERRTYADWTATRETFTTMPDADHAEGEELVIVDQTHAMP